MSRFLLVTITEGDNTSSLYSLSLAHSMGAAITNRIELFPIFYQSNGNWAMAFNQALTLAYKEEVDGIVFVAPTLRWNPENLMDVLVTDKDAVAIPVATRDGINVQLGEIARLQEDERTGEIKVQNASLDFLYLSSYSIGELCKSHPTVTYFNEPTYLVLQSGDIYQSYHTHEDVLAYRLRELGIEIWVDPRHTAYRQDVITYESDFAAILQNLKDQ